WYEQHNGEASISQSVFPVLRDDVIAYNGQPIALVIAETFEAARTGAMLVRAEYETEPHNTRLETALAQRFTPETKVPGNLHRGKVEAALAEAAARIENRYELAMEHHNPMEMHATTVHLHDGGYVVYDKNQGSQNAQQQLAKAFGLDTDTIKV